MSIIDEILKIINEFFQKGSQGLTTYDENLINPYLKRINQSMDEKTSQDFKNKIEKIHPSEELSIKDLSKLVSEMFINLGPFELLDYFYNFIKTAKENLESIFYLTPMFEKNLYEKINPLLKDLSNSYPDSFNKAAIWLISTHKDSSDYSQEAESIMILHDELVNLEKDIENAKFSDITALPDRIFEKIQKLDSNKYTIYFKDWVLKFSSLVESKIKNIFIFLNYVHKIEEKKETSLDKLRSKMLGSIFTDFNIRQNYPNIDRIRIYRNMSFHNGIEFIYDENPENRRIRLGKKQTFTITEFLYDYEKLFRFYTTFYQIVIIMMVSVEIEGKSAIDRFLDDFKKNTNQQKDN